MNGQSEIETEPIRGCPLIFNPSHKLCFFSYIVFLRPGLRVAFKCLNVKFSVTALAAWLEEFKCSNQLLHWNYEGTGHYICVMVGSKDGKRQKAKAKGNEWQKAAENGKVWQRMAKG